MVITRPTLLPDRRAAALACLVTPVLWLISLTVATPPWTLATLAVATLSVPLVAWDLIYGRLPNALTLSGYPLTAAVLLASSSDTPAGPDPWRATLGGALFFTAHLAIHLTAPSSLGGGDVKLSGWLGALLASISWPSLLQATAIAAAITLALSVRHNPKSIPHAPGLLIATWLALLTTP
ncbi:prepilin peptidase [Actinosynnema sp. NPDC020468]|uniref:prepilin peptidase n=1 Tax=Actinosynnema sp. NPDC020468 TaxID=3154488 RepID=UPI0033C37FA3